MPSLLPTIHIRQSQMPRRRTAALPRKENCAPEMGAQPLYFELL